MLPRGLFALYHPSISGTELMPEARTRRDSSFAFAVMINFLESVLVFNMAHFSESWMHRITKNSRAVAKQCAQAEIPRQGTTPAFGKEARMLRSEIGFLPVSQIGDRRCPICRSSMRLAWIEPLEKPGYDTRTFECLHCQHLDTAVVKYRASVTRS